MLINDLTTGKCQNVKHTAEALWDALCSDDVKAVGYAAQKSEWVPVNIERLNAALKAARQTPACITCAVPNCGMKAGYCGLYKPQ